MLVSLAQPQGLYLAQSALADFYVPAALGRLTKLWMNGCQLSRMPAGMNHLTALKELDMD